MRRTHGTHAPSPFSAKIQINNDEISSKRELTVRMKSYSRHGMHAGFGDILKIHRYVPKIANNQMSDIQLFS